jgi:hypothetical protein
LFTQWRKGGAPALSLLLVFIFTLTTNVVFEPAPVWAETSEEVTDEMAGTTEETSGSFISGIMNWIKSVTNAVNKMWGMENGSGVAMVVNGIFYLLLVAGTLFVGKLIFNIINETVNRRVDEKYEKPSFRKK